MNAFLPSDYQPIIVLLITLPLVLLIGFAITRISNLTLARISAWLLAIVAVAGIERYLQHQPAGFRMLAIIGVLFYSMKAVISVESQTTDGIRLRPLNWFSFAGGWFGMQPPLFVTLGDRPINDEKNLIKLGIKWFVVGISAIILARVLWQSQHGLIPENLLRLLASLLLVPGLSLALHFGILNICAGSWRLLGVNCNQLFISPLTATNLTEFWGQRWNMAFSEMTATGVYKPLIPRLGRTGALVVAFAFSGILHEMAISVPVKAGFGLPMLYFVIHGILISYERKRYLSGRPIDHNRLLGRLWTIFWLVIPMPILFHYYFLNGIIWPIIGMEK